MFSIDILLNFSAPVLNLLVISVLFEKIFVGFTFAFESHLFLAAHVAAILEYDSKLTTASLLMQFHAISCFHEAVRDVEVAM